MKFIDHLSKEQIRQFNQLRLNNKKQNIKGTKPHLVVFDEIHDYPNRPVKENLSRREWEEIMGTRRDTFERRRGAVKRR